MRALGAVAIVIGLAAPLYAQPAGDKDDAKALLASGLKLFGAQDYLGALSVFQTAYARFPSPKILLNIGTTLIKLDRKADAANAYQGYLDAPGADPAKTAEVTKVLAELDANLGRVNVTVTPGDAEVQIDKGDWIAPAKLARFRVMPGEVTVRARKSGFKPAEKTTTLAAGHLEAVALVLEAEPIRARAGTTTNADGISTTVTPDAPPGKLGMMAIAHVDPENLGGAALLGVVYDVADRITLQAAALLGPSSGGYAGATFALLTGRVRPLIAAGMPIFVANGARVAVRVAGGVEVQLNRHVALVAEVGIEHLFNPEADVTANLLIPAVGVIGRL
jgi:hypothetical protein